MLAFINYSHIHAAENLKTVIKTNHSPWRRQQL